MPAQTRRGLPPFSESMGRVFLDGDSRTATGRRVQVAHAALVRSPLPADRSRGFCSSERCGGFRDRRAGGRRCRRALPVLVSAEALANFVVSRVKHDFAGFEALSPTEGAGFSKDFAFFRQTRDDFAKPGSPEPPPSRGAAGQAGRFSRRFRGFFVSHFAATSRARQTAKLPASERKADIVRRKSRFLRLDFAFPSLSENRLRSRHSGRPCGAFRRWRGSRRFRGVWRRRAPACGRVCCFRCWYPCEELSRAVVRGGAALFRRII